MKPSNPPAAMDAPATADLSGAATVADLAALDRPALTPDVYSIALAESIRCSAVPLDMQRERLQALAAVGPSASLASAQELARHATLLDALFQRFAHAAAQEAAAGRAKVAAVYLDAALKAQRAAAAAMSALMVLRGEAANAPDNVKGSANDPDNVNACDGASA